MRLGWLGFLLFSSTVSSASGGSVDPTGNQSLLEQRLQGLLAEVQRQSTALTPFTSDGCSGGLSAGWQMITEALPALGEQVGELPPWQHCCVNHDREYWRGSGVNGSLLRRSVDDELRSCVLATRDASMLIATSASARVVALPNRPGPVDDHLDLNAELDRLYPLAAELMYRAVRIGGMPCSGLSWRWGYGWPQCGVGLWLPRL